MPPTVPCSDTNLDVRAVSSFRNESPMGYLSTMHETYRHNTKRFRQCGIDSLVVHVLIVTQTRYVVKEDAC